MKKILVLVAGLALFSVAVQAEGEADKEKGAKVREARRAESLKKYDKNGDGVLDETEKAAMREDNRKRRHEARLKKYDKNGDGKLDEAEKDAEREDMKKAAEEAQKRGEGKGEKLKEKGKGKGGNDAGAAPTAPTAPSTEPKK